MGPGPILARELVTSARRWRRFGHRFSNALSMLAVLAANYAGWHWATDGRFTTGVTARFAQSSFGSLVVLQWIVMFSHTTGMLSRAIAGEKDRKTLGLLLTTDLSSLEVVRDLVASGLLRVGSTLAAGLPVMLLLVPLGGIDPRWIAMAYAGMASSAFFLAGLSILLSVGARTERHAVAGASALGAFWLVGPMTLHFLGPRALPRLYPWFRTVNLWLLASSPIGLTLNLIGMVPRGGLVDSVARMIGLQLAFGAVLMAGAVAWLRPAFRAHSEEGVRGFRRRKAWRAPRRPPCGDDPVLWKEMYTGKGSPAGRLIGAAFLLTFCLIPLGVMTWRLGWPAFVEAIAHGYSLDRPGPKGMAFDFLVGMIMPGAYAGQASDVAREHFNGFLRIVSAMIECLLGFLLTATAVEGITTERARDTWTGLLTTPLGGDEILRAKRLGAIWRVRGALLLLIGLWTAGLVAGAIHPFGFLAAVLGLGLVAWSLPALGTYFAAVKPEAATASNLAVGVVLLAMLTAMGPLLLPSRAASVLQGALSFPFDTWLALASYRDVHEAARTGAYPPLGMAGIDTGEGVGRVALAWGMGMAFLAAGGALLRRASSRRFDDAAGRPRRAPGTGRG